MKQAFYLLYSTCILSVFFSSCKSGAINLFKPGSPHEEYQRKLTAAGLDQTAMGMSWSSAASQSLSKALPIKLPYKENGYFAAERIPATAFRFETKRGQKINVNLTKTSAEPMMIYLDIWQQKANGTLKLSHSADTTGRPLQFDADDDGTYLIRLQPELLRSGAYTLEITSGPSLGFPVGGQAKANIGSFFGDGRDENSRKHEGIDIFSKFHTPVVAAASGTVVRVNENNLGGRVVWMRPTGKDYTLYYAHLDKQTTTEGQQVKPGDTLGLMGNTGNAKNTPPHLHFGIYTSAGAIDPLAFVNPKTQTPPKVTAALQQLNTTVRTASKINLLNSPGAESAKTPLPSSTILYVNAAAQDFYKVQLPDGSTGFVNSKATAKLNTTLRKIRISNSSMLGYDRPDAMAAVKMTFEKGTTLGVLGTFADYLLVSDSNNATAWIAENAL